MIREYCLLGVGVALMKEVCHCTWVLVFQMLKPGSLFKKFYEAGSVQEGHRSE